MADNARAGLARATDEATHQAAKSHDFYIVGVGASAGGLEALEQLFDNVPDGPGMAFVVVQHLSPDFKSLMDELLARHTSLPIHRVEDGVVVEPNAIYLIPPKKNMILSYGKLLLTAQNSSGGLNLPIDVFFRSLAQDAGKRAIAVVLSGTGSDGSRGIQDVHESGGLVVVQDVESAGFDGMPRNAIATGFADVVCSPDQVGTFLSGYAADPDGFPRGSQEVDEVTLPGSELTVIFRLFRSRFGIDFTQYRANTIHRRIERRMQLIRCRELADYVTILEGDVAELDALYRDLLVEVTHFFRDTRAFERLRREVIPSILDRALQPTDEIRVWVPGCATGEEAYSLAMLLDESASQRSQQPVIKVFATDVHRNSLETASSGVYSAEALVNVPEDLREQYFSRHGDLFRVQRELRQMVIFAPHDITKDPPFTKIDLLSCRNVLIYLDPNVQRRVLSLFHFGMKVDGVMVLGPSESVGDFSREFETIDQHWRMFRKLRDVRLPDASSIPLSPALTSIVQATPPFTAAAQIVNGGLETSVMEDLLDRYVPPSFLVNEHFELMHSFGDARHLLVQPKGRPTIEVLKMVEGNLRMALSTALHRAVREKTRIVLQGVRLETDNGRQPMQIIVEPYAKRNQNLLLVCIEELKEPYPAPEPTAESFHAGDQSAQRISDLESELSFTKESLQTTVEELESSNEELQSTNEELVASNEELQSTNEELHSVNEELHTVNAEHQRKIEELTQLTADMDNLLRSTEIGTIFLDRELRIRKFTPAIATAFNVLEQDIGRPIEQFAYHFENPNWMDDAKRVIQTGEPSETELRLRDDGKTYLQRMLPYRTSDGDVDGVVISFTDVSLIAKAQATEKQRERVACDLQDFAYAVSHDLHGPLRQITEAVSRFREATESGQPNDADRSMAVVNSRTARLQQKLDCLLEYSRVNTQGAQLEPTDCNAVLKLALEKLDAEIVSTGAQITNDKLPVLLADRDQLQTVFGNLLDNAIKYCREQPPQIQLTARPEGDHWVLSVRDNGIGIQPQHLHDVFVIFRRLEFKEGVPGPGLGLALCKRIVERHGGEMWAESDGVRGATFFMQFPQK